MIPVEKALQTILAHFRPLGLEEVNILKAQGRVTGKNIKASRNIPPADNSAMDGYAVKHIDITKASVENPVMLKIIEDIPAGKVPRKKLKRGETARIMTGAIIPEGADTVIRQEDTLRKEDAVSILVSAGKGRDIRFAGEDVKKGELVIPAGTVIGPAHTGMLASLGHSAVSVYRRPRVAIMSTGDELVNIHRDPPPGKIVNSNSYALAAQVMACGGIPVMLGITRDTKAALQKTFQKALGADVIISSGGVSVGDYDFVKDVMGEMGNAMHFWQVAMRPGKPLAFGAIDGVPLFGLPGNPVSVMVSFEQFVRPSLLKMQGHTNIFRPLIAATSLQEIQKSAGIKHFIRAIVRKENDVYTASTTGEQGSGILKSMVLANGLIVIEENDTLVKKGATVRVQLLDNSFLARDLY
jgi:molybdopterin molybdotransferase